jgi:tRNA A58 N-methylase Trm61
MAARLASLLNKKRLFESGAGGVALAHTLARKAFGQNGSIICERPFDKKSGVSPGGNLCG